jgi:hypothetical protein
MPPEEELMPHKNKCSRCKFEGHVPMNTVIMTNVLGFKLERKICGKCRDELIKWLDGEED